MKFAAIDMDMRLCGRRCFLRNLGIGTTIFFPVASYLMPEAHERNGELEDTWVRLGDHIYGAKANILGPLGGGGGYKDVITDGLIVRNLDDLIAAAAKAVSGDVIFIPGDIIIDLTTYVYIDEFVLDIPAGVTLASDRGHRGSSGALLICDTLRTDRMIRTKGRGVRISGLRIQGPNGKRYLEHHAKSFGPGGARHEYYYKFPTSCGIETEHSSLEVDNCEVSAFSRAGINLKGGEDHHVHHCYIHHCQYNGLGYGITHDQSTSLIEYNLFDSNRHSIAGTGRPGSGYVAHDNVELGTSLSHCFDMHGGKDRKDGTEIAGKRLQIYNNTFRAPETPIGIRGVPEESCQIFRNWFVQHADVKSAVKGHQLNGVKVYDNAYGSNPLEGH